MNGAVELSSTIQVTGDSIEFSIADVPPGDYYLWVYVDTDASSSDPNSGCVIMGSPSSGDYLGSYSTFNAEDSGSPGITVPHDGTMTFDFEAGVYP